MLKRLLDFNCLISHGSTFVSSFVILKSEAGQPLTALVWSQQQQFLMLENLIVPKVIAGNKPIKPRENLMDSSSMRCINTVVLRCYREMICDQTRKYDTDEANKSHSYNL
jgi:hypothetical protein